MPGWFQRLKGNLFLSYCALVSQPTRKWFRSDGLSGEERFFRNYAPEGNVPTSEAERVALAGASLCIQCGLCDARHRTGSGSAASVRPSLLCHVLSRSATHLRFAKTTLAQLEPESYLEAETICPRRVPLVLVARYLKAKLQEVERAKQARKANE